MVSSSSSRYYDSYCCKLQPELTYVKYSDQAAKRHLAGRIDRVDCSLDECQEITEATREEV